MASGDLNFGEHSLGVSAPAAPAPTLIVGFGNPLRGDDGIGVEVVERLKVRGLPAGVEVSDGGTHGLDLVNLMQGRRRVILVDAAALGKRPGEWARAALDRVRLRAPAALHSAHAAGVGEALALAQALDLLPEEVVIFGVQPARVSWNSTLSPELEAALPDLITAVLAEIGSEERKHG